MHSEVSTAVTRQNVRTGLPANRKLWRLWSTALLKSGTAFEFSRPQTREDSTAPSAEIRWLSPVCHNAPRHGPCFESLALSGLAAQFIEEIQEKRDVQGRFVFFGHRAWNQRLDGFAVRGHVIIRIVGGSG
jgi:hypothetical protein